MVEKNVTPDTMMKSYWSGNEEFADFYNAVLFDGEPVISPEEYKPHVQDYGMMLIEARCCDLKFHNQNNIDLFRMLRIALNQDLTWQQARKQILEYADAHRPEKIVSIYREEGYPDQFILQKLQSKLNIAADQAMEFLQNYGKQPA